MKRSHLRVCSLAAFASLCLSVPQHALAQAAPAAQPKADTEKEDVVVLSPFRVEGTEDGGYAAKDTIAGTRIRTELKDVGASISVVTEKFLKDTGSRRAEDLLVYTTNTEVAGQGGNFVGQGDGAYLTETARTRPVANTRVRGLTEADNTRDFFLSDIPWDSYNVGRVDLQRGPNSILFGIGSPAGIVNSSLNGATMKDSNKIEITMGSFGSQRFSGDFNKVILKNELSVRLSLLGDQTKYKQDPAYKDDERIFGAVTWNPRFLNSDKVRTSLRANFEKGNINSNLPRQTPPQDAITPWFTAMNKATYDARTSNQASQTQPWLGPPGNRIYDGVVTTFSADGTQGFAYPSQIRNWPNTGLSVPGSVVGDNTLRGIATFDRYAANARLPFGDIGPYKAKSLTDAGVFDFYNNLLDGPNKHEWNDFQAFNVAFEQTYFQDHLGFELAYDRQNAKWGYETFLAGDASVITIDIMRTLLDGSANPNVGRPMTIAGGGSAGGYIQERTRETQRATAFADLDFNLISGRESTLARIFGNNVFTGLYTKQEADDENKSYNRWYLPRTFGPNAAAGSVGQASRDNIFAVYLGGSAAGASNARLGLTGVKGIIQPRTTNINVFNNVTNAFQSVSMDTWNNDALPESAKTYRLARKSFDQIKSSAFVWQGYWFDKTVIPMVGYRKDTQRFYDAGNPPDLGDGLVNPFAATWKVPGITTPISGKSKTYSLVVRLPERVKKHLPAGMDISVFGNQSANFQPDSSRRDILGNAVGNPEGKTKEYGVTISLLNDKISFKWANYETTVKNATVSGSIGGQYLIGAVEAWGQFAAYQFRDRPGTWPASTVYGTASNGRPVTWRPAGALKVDSLGNFNYTQAELDATFNRMQASINDWFAKQVPTSFQNAWALTGYGSNTYSGTTNFGASGLVVTGDTISKGNEFELVANPIKGLEVSFNAAKTSAQRTNLAQSYVSWISTRWAQFQGPMGDMRLWGGEDDWSADGAHSGETARGKFQRETMAGYNLWQALQNSDVPELRPWRFNVVANYTFDSHTKLKGTNVGGSYRWQDASVTGFPVKTVNGFSVYDVSRPYKGKAEDIFDFWVGYQTTLKKGYGFRIQANVRNVFGGDDLVPVTVQPDGSPGAFRIAEPRTFSVTTTFTF